MSKWLSDATLPTNEENERFHVFLAFDDGTVKLADWVAYTHVGSEYHATTGVYLGEYPQDGDAFYMTEDGFEVRQCEEGNFWFYSTYENGLDTPKLGARVIAWMEALKPLPPPPLSSDEEAQSADTGSQQERGQPDTTNHDKPEAAAKGKGK